MSDINKIKNQSLFILRKEPSYIYSFTILMIIVLALFILIGNFVHYSKTKTYLAKVIYEDEVIYFQTIISQNDLNKFNDDILMINDQEYNFNIIDFTKNSYDNDYSIIFKIDDVPQNIQNESFIILNLKEKKTTLFKEIYKRIKEVLN